MGVKCGNNKYFFLKIWIFLGNAQSKKWRGFIFEGVFHFDKRPLEVGEELTHIERIFLFQKFSFDNDDDDDDDDNHDDAYIYDVYTQTYTMCIISFC